MPSPRDRVLSLAVPAVLAIAVAGCDRPAPSASAGGDTPPAQRDAEPSPPASATAAGPSRSEPLPRELREAAGLMRAGRLDAARDLARRYAERHPADGRAPLVIAMTYQQTDNHEPAVPYFEQAVERSPDDAVARRYFGECLFLLGDMDGARRQYEACAKIDPGEPDGPFGIGLVDLEEARLDEAERRFRQALDLYDAMRETDPRLHVLRKAGRARCHARLGDVHFARDEYEEAREELFASIRINPGAISAFYALSLVHRRLGEDEEADAALAHYEAAKRAIIERQRSGG